MKDYLPLLPLRDIVVFPHMTVPILVGRPRSIKALEEAQSNISKRIFLCTQKSISTDDPGEDDIYQVGVVAEIQQLIKLPDNSLKAVVEGISRAKIKKIISDKDFFKVIVEDPKRLEIKKTLEEEALTRSVFMRFEEYVKLNVKLPTEAAATLLEIDSIDKFSDVLASYLNLKVKDKQNILEIFDPKVRLEKLTALLNSEIEILSIERKIMNNIRSQMEKSQKDYFLKEQLKAIEKELGEKDEHRLEVDEIKEKISKAKMPQEAEEIAYRELDKFSKMMSISPEATVVRNYIDWLVSLPWAAKSNDNLDIENSEKILNEDHYGLENAKERILEYLSVKKLSNSAKGQILCFSGPPGVGKTSLAKSVARALGRNFVQVSLGGMRDEAEIRGHRRTYIGAMPGRIIQSLRKAKSKNPVFLLDEVDKMSSDFRGDPSSALLEVLDPEENKHFSDHYLEVDFDLSEVMFITTCNIQYNIPLPLKDRMEIIKIDGYSEYEKLNIAKNYLVPKEVRLNGLKEENISISDNALLNIIKGYTKEAGVRELERKIAKICRSVARSIVKKGESIKFEIGIKNIHTFLGPVKFTSADVSKKDEVGLAMGLAWTEVGGDIMPIESVVLKGKGNVTLTGSLGEVMKESAKASISFIRSRADKLGINSFYKNKDIHIHVPEGAIPKDGPSAGITIATALASSLTKRPVRRDIAMTGEITLRGKVLPVGGLKSKILAAHRAGINNIIIPKENKKDLFNIPDNILKDIKFFEVENMDEVLEISLKKSKTRN